MHFPQVDAIKETLGNDERKVGAEIVRRSLGYPLKLIANNAGVNGSVVQQKVLESSDPNVGYNAATGDASLAALEVSDWKLQLTYKKLSTYKEERSCLHDHILPPDRLLTCDCKIC